MTSPTSAPVRANPRPDSITVLLDASRLLLTATNESDLLSQTLDLAGSLLVADAYGVWREFDEGRMWRRIASRGLSDSYPATVDIGSKPGPAVVWTVEDTATDDRVMFNRGVYLAEEIRSMMVIPWMLGDSINGAIVYYWRVPRRFEQDDVDYAVALSNVSSAALNRLELHEKHQRERQRLAFLAEASEVLSSSLDYEATLERVAQLAVSRISSWCTVHVMEGGEPTRLVVAHADPEMKSVVEEFAQKYPEKLSPDRGLGRVLSTGEPEVYPRITDEMVVLASLDEDHLRLLRRLKLSASILVPLLSRGRVLGAIRLLATGGHFYGPEDVQLAKELGRRAAAAIENAQLHRAVIEQESELRLSHAAAKMGSWSWDMVRNTVTWSDEFRALHGLPKEMEADPGYDLVHPEDRERAQREFWATLESSATLLHSEHRALAADGRVLFMQIRGRIERNTEGKAIRIAGLAIDVTESRLAEQALRRTEKLAAAGRLAATVAHEVNNPLEAIVNLVYLAQMVEGLPDEARMHLQIAEGELSRMAHIVKQTLGFYRESASPKLTELNGLVREVLELYRSRAGTRGLSLEQAEGGADLKAMVNTGEIKQVVANLISNAIDATPVGGKVEASVRRVGLCAEIVVADSGTGISEESRKHLFEPFFTTKSDVGTGLGLWVSKGIVEKHGGTLTVDPASGVGTTMRVELPLG